MRLFSLAAAGVIITLSSACWSPPSTAESLETNHKIKDIGHPARRITVYAAGDIADCRNLPAAQSAAAATAALIERGFAQDPNALVLTLGDNTYPIGKPEEFHHCYALTWGKFKSRTRPSPGNHDYATRGALGYFDYFGDLAGPAHRGYYSFEVNGWQVLSLNSNFAAVDHVKQAQQLDWLRQQLAASKAKCTLAYWHHPLFSSGGHGDRPQMREAWRLLRAAGAELVLSAHDHSYERFAPQDESGRRDDAKGVRQFVVGTGGTTLTTFRLMKSNSESAVIFRHGVLKLVLYPGHYEWEFLPTPESPNEARSPTTPALNYLDRGKGTCH